MYVKSFFCFHSFDRRVLVQSTAHFSTLTEVHAAVVDVEEKIFHVPGNSWPEDRKMKRIGQYQYIDLYDMFRGFGWRLLRSLGLSVAEVEDLTLKFKRESSEEKYRVFYKM